MQLPRQRKPGADHVEGDHAYDEGHVANRDGWGRKLKPFRNVDAAKVAYLTVAQAQRLINAADPDFRLLVRAALETGCRYSELTQMTVNDFNPDSNTVVIPKSKSGKARHVVLTPEGEARSLPTSRSKRRQSLNWSSISRPPRRWTSTCHRCCSVAPTM